MDHLQCCAGEGKRKGLVDIVYIPKGSLLLIHACSNYQNFSRGLWSANTARRVWGRWWKWCFCSSSVCNLCNWWHLITSRCWMLKSASFFTVLDTAEESVYMYFLTACASHTSRRYRSYWSWRVALAVSSKHWRWHQWHKRCLLSERREQAWPVHILIRLQSVQRWKIVVWRLLLCQPRRHWAMIHFSNSHFNVAACIRHHSFHNTL